MKILLLVPPTDLKKSFGKLREFAGAQPAIGIAYLAAVLIKNGYDVQIVDAYVSGYSLAEIMNLISKYMPDVVGISVITPSAEVVYEISRNIRALFPQIKIVMGNTHASIFSDEILTANYADFIVHREGELALLELIRALKNGSNLGSINGLSFKKNGMIINNAPRPYIENLDILPFPAWELFPMDKYSTDPRSAVKRGAVELPILATRGCPNQCTFCSSRTDRNMGSKYRMRKPKLVVDEMVYMHEKHGREVFSFIDLAFPLVREHAAELCNEIIKSGLHKKIKWISECRVKPADEKLFILMKKAGCIRLFFGIESGSNQTLQILKKNFTTDDVKSAVKMAHRAGLAIDGMFMLGLPGETEEMIKRTAYFALELNLRYVLFNLFVPYPGCELYDSLKSENKIHYKNWSDFTSYPTYSGGTPVYVPDQLTHAQLMELQKYAIRKFYLRPKFIFNELRRINLSHIKKYYYGLKGLLSS